MISCLLEFGLSKNAFGYNEVNYALGNVFRPSVGFSLEKILTNAAYMYINYFIRQLIIA
ncbi:MAG: hypothetical protein ACI9CO_000078 [Candidatus Azotimanducaceae bacterium]|jgi:hypothetical protein